MFFNLTKGMIGSLLSDQFQNIELDSKLYSLENQYLCFYVSSFIHWWLCIGFLKLSVNPHLGLVFYSSFFFFFQVEQSWRGHMLFPRWLLRNQIVELRGNERSTCSKKIAKKSCRPLQGSRDSGSRRRKGAYEREMIWGAREEEERMREREDSGS